MSVLVETLEDPLRYTREQIDRARLVAMLFRSARVVLCEPPRR